MRFLCPKCKAKYQIADEKLEGRAVRMKCRKCGDVIDVPSPAKPVVPTSGEPSSTPEPVRVGSLPSISRPLPPSPPPRPPTVRPVPPSGAPRPPKASGARLSAPSRPDVARPSPALRPVPPRATPAAPPVKTPSEPPSAGGLADAFSLRVREPQPSDVSAAIEVLSAGAGEEWYVGINGVPLGPVRLSTLRQKAQQGAINEESLVWRAGFEEWLPLRTFPELLLLVREAKEGGRVSYLPPPPQPRRLSQPPPAPIAHAAPPPAEPEQEPATVIAPSADAIALMGQVTADPFAAPKPPAPLVVAAPAEDDSGRRSIVDDIAVGVRKQVRMHPAAYVLIAIAFGFGATGAIVFFSNDRGPAPPPTIQVVTVTAPAVVPTGNDPTGATSVAMNTEDLPPEVRVGTASRPASTDNKPTNGSDDPPKTDEKGAAPRIGLGASPAIDGPSVGGPTPGSGGNLPQQLDQSDIERVVNAHRASVKRGCWEPALAGRSPNSPKSAKVTVSIGIGASGNVTSASASGGEGFPGLASCITGRVRGWKFPPSGGPSQASVPFAFFSQ